MKKLIWIVVMMVSAYGYGEWSGPLPWIMKSGLTEWQRCRYIGVDMIGEATLVSLDMAHTNENGVVAAFHFSNMLKGVSGDYVVTIPDTMRDPSNMNFDIDEWNRTKQLKPWQWTLKETYGIICISNEIDGGRMVDYVVTMDKWGAFKASVNAERYENESFIRSNKEEYRKLQDEIDRTWDLDDIGEEEQLAMIEKIEERRSEIYDRVMEKASRYFLPIVDWDTLEQTWPIDIDEQQ